MLGTPMQVDRCTEELKPQLLWVALRLVPHAQQQPVRQLAADLHALPR